MRLGWRCGWGVAAVLGLGCGGNIMHLGEAGNGVDAGTPGSVSGSTSAAQGSGGAGSGSSTGSGGASAGADGGSRCAASAGPSTPLALTDLQHITTRTHLTA